MPTHPLLARTEAFCAAYGLRVPILLAPMAGACPPSLSIAVANAGGLGSCGALLMQPAAIKTWAAEMRAGSNGGFNLNLWIPDPPPSRDAAAEDAVRTFLGGWGPEVAREAGDVSPPDFAAQCEALLNLALEACEHYYPAFQFVLWGGKTAEDAIASAVLECAGQA